MVKNQEPVRILSEGRDEQGRRFWKVQSQSDPNGSYRVTYGNPLQCTCPAGQYGRICKHRMAVHDLLVSELEAMRIEAEWLDSQIEAQKLEAWEKTLTGWAGSLPYVQEN